MFLKLELRQLVNQFRQKNTTKTALVPPSEIHASDVDSSKTHTEPNSDINTAKKTIENNTEEIISRKNKKIIGLFLLLLSLIIFISVITYTFTWQEDQSYVTPSNGGWSNLFKTYEELSTQGISPIVENPMGKIGALLANTLVYESFGMASILLSIMLFFEGFRLAFDRILLAPKKVYVYGIFLLVYTSIGIGFLHTFFSNTPHFIEGKFGFWTNQILFSQIGRTGVAGLMFFLGLAFLILGFNFELKLPEKKMTHLAPQPSNNAINDNTTIDTLKQSKSTEDESIEPFKNNTLRSSLKENITPEIDTAQNDIRLIDSEETIKKEIDPKEPFVFEITPAKTEINNDTTPNNDIISTLPIQNSVPDISTPLLQKESPKAATANTKEQEQPKESSPFVPLEHIQPIHENSSIIENESINAEKLVAQFGTYDPKLDLSNYQYPHIDLLENYGASKIQVDAEELEANKNKIVETLNHYNIDISKIKATIGPTVTLYEIIPAPGVRISKIKNLEDDIALSLAALGIRIIAPMPGQGTIGIEVPNRHPEVVSMRSILATDKFRNTNMDLPIALGKTISNEVFIADLAKMPHLLVAGATGQGKSVGINAILTSLLYKKHPAELKFVLVDPKKVELSLFRTIERHFLAKLPGEEDAIITDTTKVIHTLSSLCNEMDQRYDLLKDANVRTIKEYNSKFINRKLNPNNGHRYLPYIVLIVDEFADLMMTAGKEVEVPIARLAQLARAIGIHLVIATQRPSVNIITGSIKANFPARLAFRVLSKIDSRTILDAGGADQLIGRGDMLFSSGNDLIRVQCAFVDTPEVEKISEFIGSQRGYPSAFMLPEYVDEQADTGLKAFDASEKDPLFEDAARLIVIHQQGSTSLIQRKMKLGYNRAGRIIDQLESVGVVGPFEGSKAREVLIPDEYALEQFLKNMNEAKTT